MISSNRSAEISSAFSVTGALNAVVRIVSTRLLFWSCGRFSAMSMDEYHPAGFTGTGQFATTSSRAIHQRLLQEHLMTVDIGEHFRVTGGALKNWFIAQLQDSLAVGLLWLVGLYIIRVPGAPLWALLGAVFQFVPQIGAVLGVIGPALTAMFKWGDWEHPLSVLVLYAV